MSALGGPRRITVVRTSLILALTFSLALAGMLHAQRGGIDPAAIATALPLEGAPLAVPGPYKIESGPAFNSPDHVVYRPSDLTSFPTKDTLPLVVWGNGGCAINSNRYAGLLTTIASHGFLVMATAAQPGVTRATPDHLRAAIAWAEVENKRAGSPLNGKIAIDRISVMGQSCGGFMALELGADPRVKTIGVFNSGAQNDAAGTVSKLRGPVLLINGGERDFLMPTSEATFDAIKNLPAFYGARNNAGHTATVDHPGGGEWANVASNWARWQLKGNKEAGKMFAGKDCELCTNANWLTKSKGL
jgi:poly(3-hydroxybutyrate) depolymerase